MIPSLSSISSENDEKQIDLYAYLSVDGSQGKEKLPNTLCGQIRKCNLTKSRMVASVTLAEVRSSIVKALNCSYCSAHNFRLNGIVLAWYTFLYLCVSLCASPEKK